MTAKTNAERQAALKRRRQEAGLKPLTHLWAHPEDHPSIKAHVQSLQRARSAREKNKP